MEGSTGKKRHEHDRETPKKSSPATHNKTKCASNLKHWFKSAAPRCVVDKDHKDIEATDDKLNKKRKLAHSSIEESSSMSKFGKYNEQGRGKTSKDKPKKDIMNEEKEDLDLIEILSMENELPTKKNKTDLPISNSISIKSAARQETTSRATIVKENCNSKREQISSKSQILQSKSVSQNDKILLDEYDDILAEILLDESAFQSNEKPSRNNAQLVVKKPPNKVITPSISSEDEKLLATLLVDNSVKIREKVDLIDDHSSNRVALSVKEDSHGKYDITDDMFDENFELQNDAIDSAVFDDLNDCFTDDWDGDKIDLTRLQRCKVISTTRDERHNLIADLIHVESNLPVTVELTEFWRECKLESDEFVVIQAIKRSDAWIVDNNNGFVVTQPDHLVSGTSVVNALFCPRRGVLSEKFKGVDSVEDCRQDTSAMVIGNLVHQLLQEVLKNTICEMSAIKKVYQDMLKSENTALMLYSSGMTLEKCEMQISPFLPKIFEFMQQYVIGKSRVSKENFNGKIDVIHDIEENLWVPQLGIKGKIDVTVEVNVNSKQMIRPLEIKTGRTSFSMEHRGQVILYTMMMSQVGEDVNAGLLLYLRDNILREIKTGHHERRDLILLRNNLAYYLSRQSNNMKRLDSGIESQNSSESMELPEPIHHPGCQKCPYSALCCSFLKTDNTIKLPDRHTLTKMIKDLDLYLKPEHIDFVKKWVNMIQIEETSRSNDSQSMRSIWTLTPEKRAKMGNCIANLKVRGNVVEKCGRYLHTFNFTNPSDSQSNDLTLSRFKVSDYVIVSSNTRINIAAGRILELDKNSISLSLERNLTKKYPNTTFHVDSYQSQMLLTINLSNIGYLLDDTAVTERIRKIVIERTPATFSKKLDSSLTPIAAKILKALNKLQQRAVLKCIAANEYLLIKGMPGCGKTSTLVATIELFAKMGKSVLLTSHTHSGVDNVLLRLLEKGVDFLRLGSSDRIHPSLVQKSESILTKDCISPESLEDAYNSKNVVAVTCLGAHHPLLGKRMFDVCLVDESTQVLQSAVLRPIYSASKFVLFGDPEQLPPIVKNNKARELGMDESLFERLDSETNTVVLALQYRMNSRIMYIANKVTYRDQLIAGSDDVKNATLEIPNKSVLASREKWVRFALSTDLDDSFVMLNTGNTFDRVKVGADKVDTRESTEDKRDSNKCMNFCEAAVILHLITTLIEAGVSGENIGVMAPYRAQVDLLKNTVNKNVEVNTVDQYQGRDKDVIIYSGTRSASARNSTEEATILDDQRRLTVAITRSKYKLIIVGDKTLLQEFKPFKRLFSNIRDKDVLDLHDGSDEFSWEKLIILGQQSSKD